MNKHLNLYAAVILGLTLCSCATTPKQDQATVNKKLKIFLLSGQSNMTGRGMLEFERGGKLNPMDDQKSTLIEFMNQPGNMEKYSYLRSGPKKSRTGWTIRDDVFITIGEWPHIKEGEKGYNPYKKHGGLGPYYGGRGSRRFGPELGIGHILGNYYEDPVLLVKVSFGGNSLGKHFRPPSSGGELGPRYPKVVSAMKDALKHLPEIVSGYKEEQGYEIVGFFWNQGLSDGVELADEYEKNLVNLINDLRKDLKTPELKTVVAVTGNWGWDMADLIANHTNHMKKHPRFTKEMSQGIIASLKKVQNAQVAVSKREELKDTVATAETRDFWRTRSKYGGIGTEQHWNANGATYYLIGEEMGKEMVNLLEKKSH